MRDEKAALLAPYRVLDLSDEKGLMCGKILGDLGADVIKIEKPGGDNARNLGPFYHDKPHPEKSLFWFALNTNKRGITLNLETADGRNVFKMLARKSDFVIESYQPGYLDGLNLGYQELEKTNPDLIMVSISPFGQTGPYKDFKSSDIALWAMGGLAYIFGDVDRPPVRVSHHSQAYLHAGAQGAASAMIALYTRSLTGLGQHIDLSIQECVVRLYPTADWDQNKTPPIRTQGGFTTEIKRTVVWPCKDGHVVWFYWYGPFGRLLAEPLIQWMDEEGMGDDFLRNLEWEKIGPDNINQELVDRLSAPTGRFFMAHTKAELFEGAIKRSVQLYPVSTSVDIVTSQQLANRNYWAELEHPELIDALTYPGPFAKFSETPIKMRRRAPLIGEHNQEIYGGELGLSREKIVMLKQAGII